MQIRESSPRHQVRVEPLLYDGRRAIDIRVFALGEGGTFFPTKRGVTVGLSEIEGLLEQITEARGALKEVE